jgi:hypothetical protein
MTRQRFVCEDVREPESIVAARQVRGFADGGDQSPLISHT